MQIPIALSLVVMTGGRALFIYPHYSPPPLIHSKESVAKDAFDTASFCVTFCINHYVSLLL